MTSPHDAFLLALAEESVRLIHAFANSPPERLQVPDLPRSVRLYSSELAAAIVLYHELKPRWATTAVSYAAHAATAGAIEQLLVDLDAVVPGLVSDLDGSVTYSAADDAEAYSVVDEIARRALSTGARVMGAKQHELPDRAPLTAILRYEFHCRPATVRCHS